MRALRTFLGVAVDFDALRAKFRKCRLHERSGCFGGEALSGSVGAQPVADLQGAGSHGWVQTDAA
jgi:hypothetical protein